MKDQGPDFRLGQAQNDPVAFGITPTAHQIIFMQSVGDGDIFSTFTTYPTGSFFDMMDFSLTKI